MLPGDGCDRLLDPHPFGDVGLAVGLPLPTTFARQRFIIRIG